MTLTRLVKIDLLPVFNFCDLFVLMPSLYVVAIHVLLGMLFGRFVVFGPLLLQKRRRCDAECEIED